MENVSVAEAVASERDAYSRGMSAEAIRELKQSNRQRRAEEAARKQQLDRIEKEIGSLKMLVSVLLRSGNVASGITRINGKKGQDNAD